MQVDPRPNPPGTHIEAATFEGAEAASDDGEFYVGYLRTAAPATTRFVRWVVAGLLVGAMALALLLARLQKPFDPGTFEFGMVRDFAGVIEAEPYPTLRVERPGEVSSDAIASDYLLVAYGKRGAADLVAELDRRWAEMQGSLVFRDGQTMVEIAAGTLTPAPERPDIGALERPPATLDLGLQTLRGEIVDAKCYLGVMKPGREKPHRACAALCIRGGIPPLFVAETTGGDRAALLLADQEGREINRRVLDYVAEPVQISGRVLKRGDRLLLFADPASIRRTSE